jgi:peptide/nickel transport system substrate-binding protein
MALAAAGLLVLLACGQSGGQTSQSLPKQLKIGLSSILEVFDPAVAQPTAKVHLDLMYDHVVGLNREGTDFSKDTGVASNWTTSDQQTWVFTIRPGITFSNGDALTADDVAFTLTRLTTPVATSAYSSFFKQNLASATATGPTEVTVKLKAPNFGLLYYLSSLFGNEGDVVPHKYLQSVGDAAFAKAPVGSGPYKLGNYQPGVSITYVPASKSPMAKTKYQEVQFQLVDQSSSRLSLFRTGQLNVIDVGTADAKSLQGQSNVKIAEKTAGNQVGVGFFEQWKTTTPFNNEQFRQALSLAVDAKAIDSSVFHGLGKLTGNYPSGCLSLGCKPLTPYAYDPTKAKQLLAQSGYDGKTQIPIYAFPLPGIPELPDVATAVQGYWSAIGVNAQVVNTDYASFLQKWVKYTVGIGAAPVGFAQRPLGIAQYDSAFWSKGGSTWTHDPQIDALVDQGHAAGADKTAYGNVTAQLNQYVYDHYLSLPLVSLSSFYAGQPNVVAGWSVGNGQYDMNIRGLATT